MSKRTNVVNCIELPPRVILALQDFDSYTLKYLIMCMTVDFFNLNFFSSFKLLLRKSMCNTNNIHLFNQICYHTIPRLHLLDNPQIYNSGKKMACRKMGNITLRIKGTELKQFLGKIKLYNRNYICSTQMCFTNHIMSQTIFLLSV